MIGGLFYRIKNLLKMPLLDNDKEIFYQSIDRDNVAKGKITAITFIVIECVILTFTLFIKKEEAFRNLNRYYTVLYMIMILAMTLFLLAFLKITKDIPKYKMAIQIIGILFMEFILLWCAAISLLDQITNGEIIIYVIAIISIAVTPLYRPLNLLVSYLAAHFIFLTLLPHFKASEDHLFGNIVNSTAILIMSWAISYMRYRNRAEDFLNRKEIKEKTEELKRVNMELEKTNHKLKEANHKLAILSQTDSLTGIFNRSVFDRILEEEWVRCKSQKLQLSLVMIDIDFFKLFNDNYGHQAGDVCLKQVAEAISSCVTRPGDVAARYGGEEFAVILPSLDKDEVFSLAEDMRQTVEQMKILHAYSSVSDYVTISLGVYTVIPAEELAIEELIRSADTALYEAKKSNRNKVVPAK